MTGSRKREMLCAQSHDCDTPKLPLLKTGIVFDQLEL